MAGMTAGEIGTGSTGTATNPDDGASHRCEVVKHDTLTNRLRVIWTDLKPVGRKVETWINRNDFKPDPRPPAD